MSYTKQITYWCDGEECEEWTMVGGSAAHKEWFRAEKRGWEGGPNESYCPDCASEK